MATKRTATSEPDHDDDDDDFGPMPSSTDSNSHDHQIDSLSTKDEKKKVRVLQYEKVYLENIPANDLYERSFMHRDIVTHIVVSKPTDFIITGSIDGHIKFWKKMPDTIEFVKHFQAHLAPLNSVEISGNGLRLVTTSKDQVIKFFEIQSFDMSHMIAVNYIPTAAVWLAHDNRIAVADSLASIIRIYSSTGDINVLAEVSLHSNPVKCMALNVAHQTVVSIDSRGVIEYWEADSLAPATSPMTTFTYKSETSLYELAKVKTSPCCLAIAPAGDRFVVTSKDKQIRIFEFRSGKLKQQYDESALSYEKGGGNRKSLELLFDDVELGQKLAAERELESLEEVMSLSKPCFDESGNFLVNKNLITLFLKCNLFKTVLVCRYLDLLLASRC